MPDVPVFWFITTKLCWVVRAACVGSWTDAYKIWVETPKRKDGFSVSYSTKDSPPCLLIPNLNGPFQYYPTLYASAFQEASFFWVVPAKLWRHLLSHPCVPHIRPISLIIIVIFGEVYKSWDWVRLPSNFFHLDPRYLPLQLVFESHQSVLFLYFQRPSFTHI